MIMQMKLLKIMRTMILLALFGLVGCHVGKTRAKLIFSTTTPVPEGGVKPFRNPNDVIAYNTGAVSLMRSRGIEIDDLYGFALPRLAVLQKPVNVHFTRAGTRLLAEKVTQSIEETVCGK